MSTGYVKVDDSATDPSADKLEPGLYYFSKEGNDPSADTLGSMLKDCWAQEAWKTVHGIIWDPMEKR